MVMKTGRIGLIAALFVGFALLATGPVWGADSPIVIRFAHGDPPDITKSPAHADSVLFKRYVEDRSGGRLKVEIYPANELGSEREQIEGVQLGSIQMCNISEGTVGIFFPEILATAIPYAFRTYTEAWAALDSPFMNTLMEEMRKKTGIRCLDVNQNGFRNFSNNVRPIKTPDDLKGLKIRTMEHRGHMKMVESLGGNPVPIAWGELYTALQQKVVSGQENPPSLVYAMKFYEVQKYYTLDGHIYSIDFTFINDKFYNSLPADLRQIVYEGADIAGWFHRTTETYVSNEVAVGALIEKGMEVYVPTAEEIALFQDKCEKPVVDWIKTQIDPKWVDGFVAEIGKVKGKLKAPGPGEMGAGMELK
jgi:tripartite ATP-independent transporter DctP family solute receptor